MAIDGDELISLPNPPPPRPAARREAIDAALRKFDGIEEVLATRRRPPLIQWVSTHRAAAGGLVTAALIAVIAVPVVEVSIRDRQREAASEGSPSEPAPSEQNAAGPVAANEEPPVQYQQPPGQAAAAGEATPLARTKVAEERANLTAADHKAVVSTVYPELAVPSPMAAAPSPPPPAPPPPPPPPAQEPQAHANDAAGAGNIVVTGSRVRSANEKSSGFAQRAEAPPTPRELIAPYGEFLNRLQEALGDNDRRAVLRLVGLPLRVGFAGGAKTYRSRQEVERDYDRIFTPAVREAILGLGSYELSSRDGGKLRGSGRIWFGCGLRTCSSDETVKVREVNP
jgi:hypothetical protein